KTKRSAAAENGAESAAPPRKTKRSAAAENGAAPVAPLWPACPATNYALTEKVLVRFVHDEVTRVGIDKVVVGLSGGVDSACAAAIAVRALGPDHVIAV